MHIHEQTRCAFRRSIERGTMSVKLLAVKTGISQSHVSLFLNGHRRLSIRNLEAVLRALGLDAEIFPRENRQ